jgi:hypothetical protein
MADENKESAKGAFIEKLLFALLPLLIGCTGYLIQALGSIQHDVTILNQKVSLVVTTDNKQASNSGAELAREKLRQDLEKEIQKNRDDIMHNRQDIAVIYEKIKSK